MLAKFSIFIAVFFSFVSAQQIEMGVQKDTIQLGEYTLGELDSADVLLFGVLKNVPSGSFDGRSYLDNTFLNQHANFQLFNLNTNLQPLRNAYLPHLGFNYSAGSKASQFVIFRYEQQLSKRWLVNIDVDQKSSTGFLVASNYSDRALRVGWQRAGKRFSNRSQIYSAQQNYHFNGGIINDSSVYELPLEYIDVRHGTTQNSTLNTKKIAIYSANFINLLQDSINQFGLVTKHNYTVFNRRYMESNLVDSLFSQFNFDSTKTNDQFQVAAIQNQGGLYQSSKNFSIDVLLSHKYWNVQNNAVHRDTNEINLTSLLKLNLSNFTISNAIDFNIIGAKNEWSDKTIVLWKSAHHEFIGTNEFSYRLPEPYIRAYTANNFSYHLANLNLQNKWYLQGEYKYKITAKRMVAIKGGLISLNNYYFFNNSTWFQSSQSISNLNLELRAAWNIKMIHVQFSYLINKALSGSQLLPENIVSSRIFLQGKAFKNKLGYQVGVEGAHVGAYSLMNYNPIIDSYSPITTNKRFNPIFNLGAFGAITIQEFRFFFKASNLGYFWNNPINQEVIGYPIQKNIIQFGLTWDFYN